MNNIYVKVSQETGIPIEVIREAYKDYWKFIRKTIQELPLKENLSEEEFNNLRTNFNIVSLGKLSCNYDRYLRVKKREEYKHVKNKKD